MSINSLQTHLTMWEQQVDQESVFYRKQMLCETMSGNPVPVLTITAKPKIYNKEQVEQLSKCSLFLTIAEKTRNKLNNLVSVVYFLQ